MGRRFHAGSASFLPRVLIATLLTAGILTLTACNSGSGSTPTTSYVTGVVANGAPLVGASLILTDANGATKSTTTDSNGTYTIEATGLVAPFVVRVSGISGDAQVEMTSMLGTGPVTGQILQMDVTPLTNAVAALLSHNGDPTSLTTADVNSANLSGLLTNVRNYITNSLSGNTLGYAGDPIATQFSTNGNGYDGVLDNLAVITNPGGGAAIYDKFTLASTSTTDDTGETTSAPTPAAVVAAPLSMTQNTNFTVTSTKLDSTAIALPGNNLRSSLGNLQTALNQCFAVPSAQRGAITVSGGTASYANVGNACANFVNTIATNYLNNGLDAATQFSTNMLQSSTYDSAVFDLPYIVRYVTTTKAIVRETWTRTDGIRESVETVAVYNSNSVWQLVGNQRNFDISIKPVAEMRQDLNKTSGSFAASTLNAYTVGLNVRINMDTPLANQIMWAQVSGRGVGDPNTPGSGALLMPQPNCGYLTFVSGNASGYSSGTTANESGGSCVSYYRLAGVALDGSSAITWPTSKNYAPAMLAPADISAFTLFEPYTFRIHYCGTGILTWTGNVPSCSGTETDVYYVERLPSLMPTLAEATRLNYPLPDPSTISELTPGGANVFAGGATMPIAWDYGTQNLYALPVDTIDLQIVDGTQASCPTLAVTPSEPFSASLNSGGSRKATATASVAAPSGSSFPSASTITNANCTGKNRLNKVQFDSHRKDGFQIRSVIEYADY